MERPGTAGADEPDAPGKINNEPSILVTRRSSAGERLRVCIGAALILRRERTGDREVVTTSRVVPFRSLPRDTVAVVAGSGRPFGLLLQGMEAGLALLQPV